MNEKVAVGLPFRREKYSDFWFGYDRLEDLRFKDVSCLFISNWDCSHLLYTIHKIPWISGFKHDVPYTLVIL